MIVLVKLPMQGKGLRKMVSSVECSFRFRLGSGSGLSSALSALLGLLAIRELDIGENHEGEAVVSW